MLKQYQIKLDIQEKDNYGIYNWGSILQGFLLENAKVEYVEKLHEMKYNPYSQYIYRNETGEYIWVISTIGEEACQLLVEDNILKSNEIKLKQKNLTLPIISKELVKETTQKALFKKWFLSDDTNTGKLYYKILSPISYKSNGYYQIVPNTHSILGNLINKWNEYEETNIIDEDVYQEYANKVYISKYKLKSTKFYLEQTTIPSYIGELEISINANSTMKNILNMLFEFGEYSGLGIKTSMGMGGIRIER
ncbi:MAG: CRISPR system precrRNA processing endoribonuclease RAMP protein Cas6 [Lachnospiraceae bacterium]|jgi:CRISPR-associated endoribonuclease Cas6|nr:CRISPR system precrRNA processing endoribonuclease RAMP protein Cas6 [Lachnospiraceae bacterium]